MSNQFDAKLFDKRTSQRLIKKGLLSEKDFERHIKSLPDLTNEIASGSSFDDYDDLTDDLDDDSAEDSAEDDDGSDEEEAAAEQK